MISRNKTIDRAIQITLILHEYRAITGESLRPRVETFINAIGIETDTTIPIGRYLKLLSEDAIEELFKRCQAVMHTDFVTECLKELHAEF